MGQPCYRNGVVYVGSAQGVNVSPGVYRDGIVVAFEANTGNVLWTKIIPPPDSSIIGYANWKLLNDNEIQAPPVPTNDGVIIEPGFCVALMDSTGTLLWRSAPNVNGGFSPYDAQPIMLNKDLYGLNVGNGYFFTYALDPETGAIHWAKHAINLSATSNFASPIIDSNNFYTFSDADELFGQSLTDGSRTLYAPLVPDSEGYPAIHPFLVRGKRVYYQTYGNIMCLERK